MSGSANSGKIFNVPEPGSEAFTTAAAAQVEAKTFADAREIERNAENTQGVARQAAKAAETLGPEFTGGDAATQLKQKTDSAVAEGKQDVIAAQATGAGYVEQAKGLANTAIETVQSYLPPSVGGTNNKQ